MKIIYYVHDLHFPLREGIRKQAWWLAQAMKKEGHEVEIVSTSYGVKRKRKVIKDGIPITYLRSWGLHRVRADVIHYLIHPTPMIVPFMLFAKTKAQILTIHDGALNWCWKRIWWPFLAPIINTKIKRITIQTEYQKQLLSKTNLKIRSVKVDPLLPAKPLQRKGVKNKIPTLLFMSHLHPSKGIKDVLKAFTIVRQKIPKVQLVIADSGVTKNKAMHEYIQTINRGDIILKKFVDPEEELSKAWVYLYPLNTARETFSIPLSLIEAIQTKTPYISTSVGGIPEYFDPKILVPPRSPGLLAEKIIELIRKPKVYPLKKEINNEKAVKEYLKLYSAWTKPLINKL